MNNRNQSHAISLWPAFILLLLGLLSGSALWALREPTAAFVVTGLLSLAGLLVLALTNVRRSRALLADDASAKVHYRSLLAAAREDPDRFQEDMEHLLGLGLRYQALLLGLLLVLLAALTGFMITKAVSGFGFFLAVLLGLIFRILSTLFPRPEAAPEEEVAEPDLPEVFRLIDEARSPLGLPRPRRVFLFPDENCGVTKEARGRGLPQQDWLLIGSYLLELLTPKELLSVFIHEFAHVGHGDTDLGARITARIRRWALIAAVSEERLAAGALLGSFAAVYVTKLSLADLALSKHKERLADAAVIAHGDAKDLARAILKIELVGYYRAEGLTFSHYPGDVREGDVPPPRYHSDLLAHFKADFETLGPAWIDLILKRMSHDLDTHPSFTERLTDLGLTEPPLDLTYPQGSALQRENERFLERFDVQWQEAAKDNWADLQKDFAKAREVVEDFQMGSDPQANLDYGLALEDLGKDGEAASFYEEMLRRTPDYAPAMFRLGGLRLAANQPAGLALMQAALQIEPHFTPMGLEAIEDYLYRNGLAKERDDLEEWIARQHDLWQKVAEETSRISKNDPLVSARITPEERETLKQKLSAIESLRMVLIATKELEHSKDGLLVLGMTSRQSIKDALRSGSSQTLKDVEQIEEAMDSFQGKWILLDLHQDFFMTRPLKKIAGSELLKR